MDEKRWLDQIKESAQDLEAPASLQPEEMKHKIMAGKQEKKKLPVYKMGAAAAVLLIMLVAVRYLNDSSVEVPEKSPDTNKVEMEVTPEDSFAEAEAVVLEDVSDLEETVPHAKSREELYQAIVKINAQWTIVEEAAMADGAEAEMVAGDMVSRKIDESAASDTGDYSATNLQEAGVDEGDIVKTDGTYLYILGLSGNLRIVKAQKDKMEMVAAVQLPDKNENIQEMYLDGNTINLIASGFKSSMEEEEQDVFYISEKQYTRLYTYDITNRSEPLLKGSTTQEGSYRTSRKVGDFVYLFTEYYPRIKDKPEASTYIPQVGGEEMAIEDIYLPQVMTDSAYLVVTSIDIKEASKIVDKKAIVSAAAMFYVSTENIFICNENYENDKNFTQIIKFHYENGKISPSAIGQINGYLKDSFSLNESDGYLRAVTTEQKKFVSVNHLYILDQEMQVCGKLEDLAPGETIQSARFLGEIGYFVTFRQMDPLFSVDLSDPYAPKVLGELKITGFSAYLHFYGKDKLLGIGSEVDPDTGENKGIKLSMFDISDPENVTEIHKYVIKDAYDCQGLYNHKAIMMAVPKNLIGFACDDSYLVFSYDREKGFINEFLGGESYMYDARGIHIGDYFYLVKSNQIRAFDMKEKFKETGELRF